MKNIAKLIALFYGCQFAFAGIGMGLFCYVNLNVFSRVTSPKRIDLRLSFISTALIPQIGLGTLLIWIGLPTRSRQRLYQLAGKAMQRAWDK